MEGMERSGGGGHVKGNVFNTLCHTPIWTGWPLDAVVWRSVGMYRSKQHYDAAQGWSHSPLFRKACHGLVGGVRNKQTVRSDKIGV